MRPLWIIVLVVVAVLGITSVASASMRDEVSALVDAAVNLAADDEQIPDEPPLPDPADDDGTDQEGDDGTAEEGDEGTDGEGDDGTADDGDEADGDGEGEQNRHRWRIGDYRNHGEAVSEMAKCKDDTGQNHGAAVSAVAKSQAGKPDKAGKPEK